VGAADTFRISRDEELARFLSEKADAGFIMEEFIDGTIFTFDGLTDGQERIVFCSWLQYGSGMMELVNEQLDVFLHPQGNTGRSGGGGTPGRAGLRHP
jgi:hypothetical protein